MITNNKFKDNVEVINLLSNLVNIPSENPPGDEYQISQFIINKLKANGFTIKILKNKKNRINIIAKLNGSKPGKKILLNGHMDTKPAHPKVSYMEKWKYNPFSLKMSGDKLYGLGTADMKGGLASLINSSIYISKFKKSIKGKLILLLVSDEEMNSTHGMKYLIKKTKIDADMAINLEPTELNLCPSQLGNVWLNIEVFGKMGHASEPYKSINAIDKSILIIQKLNKEITKLKKINKHNLFPNHPTLNIGAIEGGYHPGTVPGYCKFNIDIRVKPNETKEYYIDLVKKTINKTLREDKDAYKVKIANFGSGGLSPSEIKLSENIIISLSESYKKIIGKEPKIRGLTGGTDANFLVNNWKIPTIVFGPGSLEQAHQPNEYTSLKEVILCEKILTNFLFTNLVSENNEKN